MSIKIMTHVWENSAAEGTALLMLLAIADHANDDGVCWPSVASLAQRARVKERQAQNIIKQLEQMGEIEVRRGAGRHQTSVYVVKGAADCTQAPKKVQRDAPFSRRKGAIQREKVQSSAGKGAIASAPEPLEPSIEPSVVSDHARVQATAAPTPTLHPDLRAALERAGVVFTPDDLALAASWAQLVPLSWQLDAVAAAVEARKPFIAYIHAIVTERHAKGRAPAPAEAPPAPPQPEHADLADAVCRAVGYDARTLPRKRRDQVHAAAATLAAAAYTPADVDAFSADVWPKDWRWTKNKSLPTVEQLLEEIGKVRKHATRKPAGPHPGGKDDPRRALRDAKKRELAARAAGDAADAAGPGLPGLQGHGLGDPGPAAHAPALRPGGPLPLPLGADRPGARSPLAAD